MIVNLVFICWYNIGVWSWSWGGIFFIFLNVLCMNLSFLRIVFMLRYLWWVSCLGMVDFNLKIVVIFLGCLYLVYESLGKISFKRFWFMMGCWFGRIIVEWIFFCYNSFRYVLIGVGNNVNFSFVVWWIWLIILLNIVNVVLYIYFGWLLDWGNVSFIVFFDIWWFGRLGRRMRLFLDDVLFKCWF